MSGPDASKSLEMQLAKCWRSVRERLADESSTPSGELAETIDDSLNRAAREGFLSTNELLDEMSTASLPCVLLPYFKAKVLEKGDRPEGIPVEDIMKRRYTAVKAAKTAYGAFLMRAMDLEMVQKAELQQWQELEGDGDEAVRPLDANAKRLRKIERFRRQQAAEQTIKELDAQLRQKIAAMDRSKGQQTTREREREREVES